MPLHNSLRRHLTRSSIAVKMLLLTMIISVALWWMLDRIHLQDLRRAFLAETKRALDKEAQDDRRLFDQKVRTIHSATKLIISQKTFLDYITQLPAVSSATGPRLYHVDLPPKWLPKASILRTFFNARYALLVGSDGRTQELYHHAPPGKNEGENEILGKLIDPGLLMRKLSHNQSYMTTLNQKPFVISAQTVRSGASSVTLLLASPIDDEFLTLASSLQRHSTILALVDPLEGKVVASSNHQKIPIGIHVKKLEGSFLQTGKSFFDYGASDLELQFSSFYATEDAERLSNQILAMNSRQRAILVGLLIFAFLLLSLWWSHRIGQVARRVERFSESVLGVSLIQYTNGDELDELERDFKNLATEVERSRDQLQQEVDYKSALAVQLRDRTQKLEQINLQLKIEIKQRLQREKELQTAREQAEVASHAKSEFLSRMSHELRTPLNAILGFGQLLEINPTQPLNELQAGNVREILNAGNHLLEMVNEILDLNRIESGQFEIKLEAIAIAPLLEKCVSQLRPMAMQRNISIEVESNTPYAVTANRARLRQVLLNLFSNAIKYNRKDGKVYVCCQTSTSDRLRISVQDTGHGITADLLPSLFKPFERLESAYEGIEGTGIGLVLAKKLIESMHGDIGVESVPDEGSIFWIELPLTELSPADLESTAVPITAYEKKPHKLLYVEDDPANLKLVQKILTSRREFELLDAVCGKAGMDLAVNQCPELILLDINLPDMNGFELLRQLQNNSATRDIPVIAVTANAMPHEVERGMAAGFTDYLIKPVDVEKILTTLERHIIKTKKNRI